MVRPSLEHLIASAETARDVAAEEVKLAARDLAVAGHSSMTRRLIMSRIAELNSKVQGMNAVIFFLTKSGE